MKKRRRLALGARSVEQRSARAPSRVLTDSVHQVRHAFLDDHTRTRRNHAKYLTLIESNALLYQHQREIRVMQRGARRIEYIEVTLDDIALANWLAHDVRLLGASCALAAA